MFERALTALEAKAEASSREQARAIALLEERLAQAQNAAPEPPPEPVRIMREPPASAAPAPLKTKFDAFLPQTARQPIWVPKPAAEETPQSTEPTAAIMPAAVPAANAATHDAEIPEILVAPETGMVLLMPDAPRGETFSREEMAEVLASARKAARHAADDENQPQSRTGARLRWIVAGVLCLVAAFVGVGLSLGGSARATQTPVSGAGAVHRQGSRYRL